MKLGDALIVAAMVTLALMLFWGKGHSAEIAHLTASYYSTASLVKEGTWKHGEQRMANGERFRDDLLICASRLYPLGTRVKVTNLANGKSIIVKVADRIGKRFATTRIDLSKGAFERIGNIKRGLLQVTVERI